MFLPRVDAGKNSTLSQTVEFAQLDLEYHDPHEPDSYAFITLVLLATFLTW